MALIKCPACGREVSDQAHACPVCGQPLREGGDETVQTIQLTKKKWKKIHLMAVALFFVGLFCLLGGKWGLALFAWFIAFVVGMAGRIGAWWSTG